MKIWVAHARMTAVLSLLLLGLPSAGPATAADEAQYCPLAGKHFRERPELQMWSYKPPMLELPRRERPELDKAHSLEGANLINADLSYRQLNGANLTNANLISADLRYADLVGADLTNANLSYADLSHADLHGAHLRKTKLFGADLGYTQLTGADLNEVDLTLTCLLGTILRDAVLTKTDLAGADLSTADLSDAKLSGVNLSVANLHGAQLRGTDLGDAAFKFTNLSSVVFEPTVQSVSSLREIESANHLSRLTFWNTPAALVALRERFAKQGLRSQEREVTFAKLRTDRHYALRSHSFTQNLEGVFSYLAFELTCGYGLYYGRPLRILVLTIPVLGVLYAFALRSPGNGAIWRVWVSDRVRKEEGQAEPERLSWQKSKWSGGPQRSAGFRLFRALGLGLLFSLISAFQIGWHDLNVGNWITRLQPREYTLRATGWVRVVSGAQSLLSVYLLALWALSYFSRPFE